MPITLAPNKLFAKKEDGSGYLPANVVTGQTTEEQCALIEAKGAQTRASIPDDYTALSDSVVDLKSAFEVLNPALSITWTLGKTMSSNGVITDNNYTAISQKILCSGGDVFKRTGVKLDPNNKQLSVWICEFNGGTCTGKTELTGSSSSKILTLASTTTSIYIIYGRYSSSGITITQNDIDTYFGCEFIRQAASYGEFKPLKDSYNADSPKMILNQMEYTGNSVNDINANTFYYSAEGKTGNPTASGGYFIQTILYNASGSARMQIAYKYSDGSPYYRRYVSGSWGSWNRIGVLNFEKNDAVMDKYAYAGNDINDIADNSFVFSAEGTTNNPTSTGGYFVQTIQYSSANTNACMQIAYRYDNGMTYYRRKASGTWNRWYCNSAPASPSRKQYYAFGDSLTYGAVWQDKEGGGHTNTQAAKENQIPTRIANAVGAAETMHNQGVGGAYFVGSGSNTIMNAIQAVTMTGAGLITVAGGRNDSDNTLGDKNSAVNDGTICGAIKAIIEYLQTNYPKTQIVWIGVTPNTSNNATVFTRVFAGGWSLNSFDEKVSELCAEYCVPYVSWKGCTYMRHWADFSGADGVYSHPNNEESYLQMGNYIAGQVSQYYRG